MDDISSYIKMEVLRDVIYIENGVRANFIDCAIKILKPIIIVQTNGDLVGG